MESSLFQIGNFTLNSGRKSDFKIECDALSLGDLEAIAYLLSKRVKSFCKVVGVPRGGIELAIAMKQYCIPEARAILLVDDVYTTGGSMARARDELLKPYYGKKEIRPEVNGAVIFARNPVEHPWIVPLFTMSYASQQEPLPQPGVPMMDLTEKTRLI